jgi:Transglutaminase-like superfamily
MTMRRALPITAAALALVLSLPPPGAAAPPDAGTAPPARQADSSLFLASFPVESHLAGSLFAAAPVQITLRFDPAQAHASNELVRRLRIAIGADGSLVVPRGAYPSAKEKPARQNLRPSFLVDYDEPAFKPVLDEARAQLGATPTIDDLVRFVDKFITKKGFGRGFDIASVVARRREGDCTEHAVLTAALARAFRLPSRVVEGILLVEAQGTVLAFGHAWAEVYTASAWRPADAAFPGKDPLVYLPLDLISDEGPGFAMSMAQTGAGTIGVRRIVVAQGR